VNAARVLHDRWIERGKTQLTPAEIQSVMGYYRCQMKELQAIAMLHSPGATQALEKQAFRPGEDFSQMNAIVAAFQLWDRIGSNPQPAIRALQATDHGVADKTEWILVQGGPSVLPALRAIQQSDPRDEALAAWAIEKIEIIHPKL
jgi:glycerophosphoryl diester phosphodiesterase